MRAKSLLLLIVPAMLLAILIAAVPSGPIAAQGCVDSYGRPAECPDKKRPTIIYPSFTPTLTRTPVPTATKVPTKTSTVVQPATTLAPKIPAGVDIPAGPGDFLLPGGILLVVVSAVVVVRLFGGEKPSKFTADAHGPLNPDETPGAFELVGDTNEDGSQTGSAGMFTDKEDE